MHYNFLFNGCSWTYGTELEGLKNNFEYRTNKRFSHLVSDYFKMTYDNISGPGRSNDWIIKQTVDWFNKGNTCDIAIIQFTEKDRKIIYDNDNNGFDIRLKKEFLDNDKKERARIFYKYLYTDYMGEENFYKNAFLVNQFLKSKNIKTIFMSLENNIQFSSEWSIYCKDIDITFLKKNILPPSTDDKNFYCKSYRRMYEVTKDPKFNYRNGTHPNEFGHEKIAQYLIDQINTML